jgi:copper chaperone CopZ
MKTSVIEVRDMLSVLSVLGVEKRIGEVPGVESVTINYAAGSATVRYDETRLNIADIKSAVRQSEYESATPAVASASNGHEGHPIPDAPPTTPAPAAPKPSPVAAPPPHPRSPLPRSTENRIKRHRVRCLLRRNRPRTSLPPCPRVTLLQATENRTKRRRTKVRTTPCLRSCR